MRILIFTDLDGSLLDHDDYSHAGADHALDTISREGLPLIFVTSKTRSEVEALRRELGVDHPFVVENGGGIFFPSSHGHWEIPGAIPCDGLRVLQLGETYDHLRRFVQGLPDDLTVRGFGDMGAEEVAGLTGLSLDAARRAMEREFTEPFLVEEEERLPELAELAAAEGIAVITGGRFHHLVGRDQDKGRAVRIITESYRNNRGAPCYTVGLGDGPNDVPMLEVVDRAVLIPNPGGRPVELQRHDVSWASEPGSSGWGQAVLAAIEEIVNLY
jgi:mannosyl-3-phosphoglycerate phosphatase